MAQELSYDLSNRGDLPLYEYLYRCIRDDIVAGAIAAEDRLPSKRRLAERLGVSLVTVESAYAQLVAEGYVVARPRRGYYVAELPQAPSDAKGAGLFSSPDSSAPAAAPTAPDSPVLADFSQPTTPERSPAAALWGRALRSALAREPESELFGSLPAKGSMRLRRAIARDLRETRGMEVDPECIVVGAGAQALYVLIAQLLGPGRAFAVEDPGYPRLAQVYGACGAQVRYLPLDSEGIDAEALRASDASVVHVMPSHQFPTGRVTSIARRYELLSWASQGAGPGPGAGAGAAGPGRYIVEDDYDRAFRLAGMPIPPLQSIDAEGRVIYVSTFSKSLSSALRMAYMVLPPRLAARFGSELGFYASSVSMVDQVTLARLFESGEYERHVSRYRKRQRDVRDALIAAIRESALGPVAAIEEADSGLHFVLALDVAPDLGPDLGEEEIARRAAEGGVVLAPLSRYLHDAANARARDGRKRFVMQYEGLDVAKLPQVIAVLERAVSRKGRGISGHASGHASGH